MRSNKLKTYGSTKKIKELEVVTEEESKERENNNDDGMDDCIVINFYSPKVHARLLARKSHTLILALGPN